MAHITTTVDVRSFTHCLLRAPPAILLCCCHPAGPGRQYFDAIRTQGLAAAMTGASADKSSQSLMAGTGASASTGSSGSKFGGYGSSSSGGYGSASSGGGVYGSKSTDL